MNAAKEQTKLCLRGLRAVLAEIFPRESKGDFRGKREETDEFFEGDRR